MFEAKNVTVRFIEDATRTYDSVMFTEAGILVTVGVTRFYPYHVIEDAVFTEYRWTD